MFNEPPYAEPHVRWCERTAGVILPPTRLPVHFRAFFEIKVRPASEAVGHLMLAVA